MSASRTARSQPAGSSSTAERRDHDSHPLLDYQPRGQDDVELTFEPTAALPRHVEEELLDGTLRHLASSGFHRAYLTISVSAADASDLFQHIQSLSARHKNVPSVTWHAAGTSVLVEIELRTAGSLGVAHSLDSPAQ